MVEAAAPGAFFGKKQTLSIKVDDKGFTRVDASAGKPVDVCFEPKRDDFMRHYIAKLTGRPSAD